MAGRLSLTHSTMAPIHDAANNGDLDALAREIGNGVSPDIPHGFNGLMPLHLVIANNNIDVAINVDNRLACVRLLIDADAESDDAAYFQKMRAAGSFQNYERDHLNAIAATFAPKFTRLLPPELVRRVVEYAFHVGDY